MEVSNIIAALRRNRFGAVMVVVQVALTLAIVANAMFIGSNHVRRLQEPSGLDEKNIFSMTNQWIGPPNEPGPTPEGDLRILRGLPDVVDAYATNALPMSVMGENTVIGLDPLSAKTGRGVLTGANMFWVDEHALRTLGLRLIAGRWFEPQDVVTTVNRPTVYPAVVISRRLAEFVFPDGDAVGKRLYGGDYPLTVVGVIDKMTGSPTSTLTGFLNIYDHALLVPYRRPTLQLYVIRTRPGQVEATMREAERQLRAANPLRIISQVRPFIEDRWEGLRENRSLALLFAAVCFLLLAVTALGIVGVTSFWISQRRHQIGMRRALGARRHHILLYYQTENLLVVGLGAAIGVGLAVGLNLWLMNVYETERMDWSYVVGGGVLVLILGQLAAFWPARRAASIPPALATRAS
jgi:putative ABC transport system permease protein